MQEQSQIDYTKYSNGIVNQVSYIIKESEEDFKIELTVKKSNIQNSIEEAKYCFKEAVKLVSDDIFKG